MKSDRRAAPSRSPRKPHDPLTHCHCVTLMNARHPHTMSHHSGINFLRSSFNYRFHINYYKLSSIDIGEYSIHLVGYSTKRPARPAVGPAVLLRLRDRARIGRGARSLGGAGEAGRVWRVRPGDKRVRPGDKRAAGAASRGRAQRCPGEPAAALAVTAVHRPMPRVSLTIPSF